MGEPGASGSGLRFRRLTDPGIEQGKPERGESGQAGGAYYRGWLGWGYSPLRASVAKQSGRLFTDCLEPSALRPATLRRDPRASGSYLHPLS